MYAQIPDLIFCEPVRGILNAMTFNNILALGVLAIALLPASATDREYTNSKFNYKLTVPARWNIDPPESGVPVLFNYKRSEGGPQGLFPNGGANIYLIPLTAVQPTTPAKTLDEWINQNIEHDHKNASVKKRHDVAGDEKGPQNVVEVQSDFVRDSQDQESQREVSYYFSLNGATFRLMLLYWKQNPHGARLQAICESVLRSIRAQ
jgi:hypothetical protein